MVDQEKSNCLCCGIEINKHPKIYNKKYNKYYIAKNKTKKFCSHACAINIRKKTETRKCEYCNKDFSAVSWEKKRFCNSYCAGKSIQTCKKYKSWIYRKIKKEKVKTPRIKKQKVYSEILCIECGVSFMQKAGRKCCSNKCRIQYRIKNNKGKRKLKRKILGKERKIKLIEKLGGKCSKCGYNKSLRAMTFHHRNPEEKRFTLDQQNLQQKNYELILLESEKCDLLCFNCHMELHEELLQY